MRRSGRARRALAGLALAAALAAPGPAGAHPATWKAKLLVGLMALPFTGSGCTFDDRLGCVPGYAGQTLTFIDIQGHVGNSYTLSASAAGLLGRADFDVCFLSSVGAIIRCDRNHTGTGNETGKTVPPAAAEARVELYYGVDAEFTLTTS